MATILGLSINIFAGENPAEEYSGNCCSKLFDCIFPCSCCNPEGTACYPYEALVVWCSYTDAAGQEQPGACRKSFSAAPCAWPCGIALASYIACSNRYNACVTNNPSENRGSLCVGQLCGKSCWENFWSRDCGSAFCHDFCTKRISSTQKPGNNSQMQ